MRSSHVFALSLTLALISLGSYAKVTREQVQAVTDLSPYYVEREDKSAWLGIWALQWTSHSVPLTSYMKKHGAERLPGVRWVKGISINEQSLTIPCFARSTSPA